ncbi:MAG: hypothetical protein AUH92_02550 [Acidobacteria bacterium 13_1_40CM_4_69_4]|nr:MAG: hypothetical protein AUH92_02550 [Acidobacteria bacterium 13_1_40CM_4_69_4]
MQSRRKKLMKDLKQKGELRGAGTAGGLTDLLYDELTDLPTVPLLLGRIRRMLRESQQLGLLSISVLQNERGEQTLGWQGYESLVRSVASFLVEVKKVALRRDDYVSEVMISGNAFVILLSPPRGEQGLAYPDIDKVRSRVAVKLERFVRDRLPAEVRETFGLYVGCTVLSQDSTVRFERLVYSALEQGAARGGPEAEDGSQDGGRAGRVSAGRRRPGEARGRVRGADPCPRGHLPRSGSALQGRLRQRFRVEARASVS